MQLLTDSNASPIPSEMEDCAAGPCCQLELANTGMDKRMDQNSVVFLNMPKRGDKGFPNLSLSCSKVEQPSCLTYGIGI